MAYDKNKPPVDWYLGSYSNRYVTLEDQNNDYHKCASRLYENKVIVKASSIEDAHTRIEAIGKKYSSGILRKNDFNGKKGASFQREYLGITDILPICEETADAVEIGSLSKYDIKYIADEMLLGDVSALKMCIGFFLGESRGIGDGRVRALIARRLKHCPLTPKQESILTDCILDRFLEGRFSEGFKDQMRLVRKLNLPLLIQAAQDVQKKPHRYNKLYVLRYAQWILSRYGHDKTEPVIQQASRAGFIPPLRMRDGETAG